MEPMREEAYIMRIFGNISQSILMSFLYIIAGLVIIVYLEINRKKLVASQPAKEAMEVKQQ